MKKPDTPVARLTAGRAATALDLFVSLTLVTLLAAVVLFSQALRAADEEAAADAATSQDPPTTTPVDAEGEILAEPTEKDLAFIDQLLAEDEDGFEEAGTFTYDDGGRRDPFRSLLSVQEMPELRGPRPDGIAGLLIDELLVTGVWITTDGPVAQIQSPTEAKNLLLRPGDQLYDGDVVDISYDRSDGAEVVFKQLVEDPTAPKPYREVVKKLSP